MVSYFFRQVIAYFKPLLRDRKVVVATGIFIIAVASIIYSTMHDNKRIVVDQATLTPLLNLIAKAESSGNYNAYFGHGDNDSIKFTEMSVADVLKWQADYVAQGSASSAVGRYQIIDTTLRGLVAELELDTNMKFDTSLQDRLATTLIIRRGVIEYLAGHLTAAEFGASLAKEWAGLPKVTEPNPDDSYYASDGLNKARVKTGELMQAITPIAAKK